MRKFPALAVRLLRDGAGNVLPIAAIGLLVAAGIVGSALDLSRDYKARNQLQSACDAAVLAGRRTVTTAGYDTASQTAATNYFKTNFDESGEEAGNTTFTSSSPDGGKTVNGVASTTVNTLIMRIFGFNSFSISVNCASSMGVGNADVMMVLDNTGSMSSTLGSTTRIAALRQAMNNFYTTLQNATASSNARIRYGFVPFSTTVNVGRLLYNLNPKFLADSYSYQTRVWQNNAYTYGEFAKDTSVYKTFAPTSVQNGLLGTNVSYTWNGCIHERKTVAASTFTYVASSDSITPTNALDVDIDTAPTVSDDSTKWAPIWPDITYWRKANAWSSSYTLSNSAYGDALTSQGTSYYPCPVAAQGLQTMTQSAFNAYANSMVATGNTYLDIGIIWGGRMMSPDGIFSATVNDPPSNGGNVGRHIIFMTDGFMEPNNMIDAAWGTEYFDRNVTSDGSTNEAARHTQRFLAVCQAVKAKGVRLWVIAFTSSLSSDLQTCASDSSSFTASNSSELSSAFQEIAKQVGELRIIQ